MFSSCGRCSRLSTGTSGTHSGGLRKGHSPWELLGGLSGFLSRRCCGLRPRVESAPEPEDSSPVLTWILGYFWSLARRLSPRLEWGHARALSSRAVAAVSRFPSLGSRDLWLSLEAFPRGFPTGLPHVPLWCESILGLKVEAVQGNQVPWNGLRHLGDSGNMARTLSSSRFSSGERLLLSCDGNAANSFPTSQGKVQTSRARRRKRGSS